jgi:TonB family protein
MNTRSQLLAAYELKSAYQRNTLIGFGLAGGLHLLIIGIMAIIIANSNSPIKAPTFVLRKPTDIMHPPIFTKPNNQIKVVTPQHEIKPKVGKLVPVPEEEAPEDVEYATQNELIEMAPDNPVENLEGLNIEVDVESIRDELFPDPEEFVPREVDPVQINTVNPVYPPLAQRAGIQGAVWVKALVDEEGKVLDVIIVKDSGAKAGFAEAAMDAAYKTTWKPAIANGQPIALWVTYKVEFVLK